MQIHDTIAGLRTALKGAGRIAFVPTMGNLHEGHIALMRQAQAHGDTVVSSLFSEPPAVRPEGGLRHLPAHLRRRLREDGGGWRSPPLLAWRKEMYPTPQAYHVQPDPAQADILEGEFRPGFFRGVATVVMKLFSVVQPQVAILARRDYQQLMIIRKMVRQFALPIEIIRAIQCGRRTGLACPPATAT
ncbi:MAG: pantoate--beta-alanine ligase [Rhodocyclaceae bacterium]|nr:pantoate--beta-alanine ligase [Rhodocyclaceae bacterium]